MKLDVQFSKPDPPMPTPKAAAVLGVLVERAHARMLAEREQAAARDGRAAA